MAATPNLHPETRALILAAGAVQIGISTLEHAIQLLQDPQLRGFNLPTPAGAAIGQTLANLVGDCPGCCPTCACKDFRRKLKTGTFKIEPYSAP